MGASIRRVRLAAATAILIFEVACANSPPVGTNDVSPERVQRELSASILSTGHLSAPSRQVLERLGLHQGPERDRKDVVSSLLEAYRGAPDTDVLFALAEVSYQHAEASKQLADYIAVAVYAYALLFPGGESSVSFAAWDPRLRTTYDLYNRALAEGLLLWAEKGQSADGVNELDIAPGHLSAEWRRESLEWNGFPLRDLVSAAHLKVRGLRNRYRRPGVGAPFIATLEAPSLSGFEQQHIPPGLKVPVTAFLRIEEPVAALARGKFRGRLEVYSPDNTDFVSIDGADVPLETETTSALAHTLERSRIWQLEFSAFFSGDLPFGESRRARPGLLLIHPYRPGRIPLVLVHGTASSPARWAELVNEIDNDPRLSSKYQIWLFLYNTGNPIGYSGGLLCSDLSEAVQALDPEQSDGALRRMVLLGHSQGGLLAKLAVVSSGDRFWQRISEKPLDSLDLPADTRKRLRSSLFFEPLPFVKRVIFLATPQRGSYLASFSLSRFVSDFIKLPKDLAQVGLDFGKLGADAMLLHKFDRLPTSLDNMTPGNPFIQTLASLPVDTSVAANSIIAVKHEGPPLGQSDGVVRYESAHLEGVESEKVVRSAHSAQSNPETIKEVRRILLDHLASSAQP